MHVSVLMPARNVEAYLPLAIQSTLVQSHCDWELIIIDDGSTDSTLAIAEEYAAMDSRVRVFTQACCGIARSLNRAVELASHEWLVRMDADDVMLPHRIERQIAFVSARREVAVAASWVRFIDAQGRSLGVHRSPLTKHAAVRNVIERNELIAITHPSVMMRRSAVEAVGGYRPAFDPADDLDLWGRLAERGYNILVQPEVLLQYRIHNGSVCTRRAAWVDRKVLYVRRCMLDRRAGRQEMTWEEFEQAKTQSRWLAPLDGDRRGLAEQYFGLALWRLERREYHLFARNMMASMALRPVTMTWRIVLRAARKLRFAPVVLWRRMWRRPTKPVDLLQYPVTTQRRAAHRPHRLAALR